MYSIIIHIYYQFRPCVYNWVCHLTHEAARSLEPVLRDWIRAYGINETSFRSVVEKLVEWNVLAVPSLPLTQFAESKNNSEELRSIWKSFRDKSVSNHRASATQSFPINST
jgi:hypothetical protein